jgi:hypothetical protein
MTEEYLAAVGRLLNWGNKLKIQTGRLGIAGALAALLLSAVAVPAHASPSASPDDPCGPVIGSVMTCTAIDGWTYEVPVKSLVGPVPGIGGALMVGNTLTVFDGPWEPRGVTLRHEWLRNGVPVLGAVRPTYKLTAADSGKGITVATTATAAGYQNVTVRSATSARVTVAGGAVPTVIAPTTVLAAGTNTFVGSSLTAHVPVSDWATPGIQFHYQWLRDGTPVPGATGSSYYLTPADSGKMVRLRVTGYAPGFDPVTRTSVPQLITNDKPGAEVTGSPEPGQVLTGVDRSWNDAAVFTHQWLRDGTVIPGATGLSYKVTAEDQGNTLVLRTDGSRADNTPTGTAYSAPITVPGPANSRPLTNIMPPALTGNLDWGKPITVTAGAWSEPAEKLAISYRWFDGSAEPTFTPEYAHIGKKPWVTVSITAPGYTTTKITVTAPAPVAPPVPRLYRGAGFESLPEGGPAVGQIVSLFRYSPSWARSWNGGKARISYQWMRGGVPIPGATRRSYTPGAADLGKALSVKVTSTWVMGTTQTQTLEANKVRPGTLQTARPAITGTAKTGSVLKGVAGRWTKGAVLTYRWYRNGVPITGARAATYKAIKADKGVRITVRVTGTLHGYLTASRHSPAFIIR